MTHDGLTGSFRGVRNGLRVLTLASALLVLLPVPAAADLGGGFGPRSDMPWQEPLTYEIRFDFDGFRIKVDVLAWNDLIKDQPGGIVAMFRGRDLLLTVRRLGAPAPELLPVAEQVAGFPLSGSSGRNGPVTWRTIRTRQGVEGIKIFKSVQRNFLWRQTLWIRYVFPNEEGQLYLFELTPDGKGPQWFRANRMMTNNLGWPSTWIWE